MRKPAKWKSLMAEWLEQAFKCHEMFCHDLEVMSMMHVGPNWTQIRPPRLVVS